MATIHQNLSELKHEKITNGQTYTIAIIRSEWNDSITLNLTQGAKDILLSNSVPEDQIIEVTVPGAYELPLASQWLAEKSEIDAIICIGSIIRGETSHFEYVSQAVSQGIKDVSLKYGKPVVFGVLTDDHIQQSIDRSGGIHGNKGVEAGFTALRMLELRDSL